MAIWISVSIGKFATSDVDNLRILFHYEQHNEEVFAVSVGDIGSD